MLNLSDQKNTQQHILDRYSAVKNLGNRPHYKILNRLILAICIIGIIVLFLPWTQNISGSGAVTALKPNQRPQTINTVIAGRIEKWYVQEGDYVKKGDTIIFLSEVKEEYFDPNLLENTKDQVNAKKMALESYHGKVAALNAQVSALEGEKSLKHQQARNKIKQSLLKIESDSMDFEAVKIQLKIALTQAERSIQLQKEGLKPVTDVEEKRLKLQDVQAKVTTQENKLLTSRNELINARLEVERLSAEYAEKISKAKGDKFTTLSNQADASGQLSKLENQYANYSIRNGMYYIKAPQDGYVNRALQSGLGETVKEGVPIVSIMPAKYEFAVETFVSPIDMILLKKGEKIRVWFDGWPTIVFSGWPDMSYGTFGGKIVAIENFISPNGKYRVLIAPDPEEDQWPKQLSMGSGAETIALLETVPVWFEIWRTLNGFPPNYYQSEKPATAKK
ncbi:HlyD family efflux transporter periplasmic adaptor subunit [Pedobacter sp. N36a]|uniref:HlyD family secretion protein n=1 Tax=Pedobacter sp. N36a TaxID=2767996 RepID=UPI0016575F82|nr:biotin/lipoyl-binding protein [Pedobacter sp. N36a]MBC8988250.1 HlyD family efflux transporter periplasmic adaptor subunit [Pedobacter sp. N36a]